MRTVFATLLLLAIGAISTIWGIDVAVGMKAEQEGFFYSSDRKVWAHRGYFENAPENSLAAFQAALEHGAPGSEMDIFFDVALGGYVVSHDHPYHRVDGQLVMLSDVLNAMPEDFTFWFDFKNLMFLSASEVTQAMQRLHALDQRYNIAARSVVESENAYRGRDVQKAGFHASYWLNLSADTSAIRYFATLYKVKLLYLWGAFNAISMDYVNFDARLEQGLAGIPLLLFTVDDPQLLAQFRANEGVRIILTDSGKF